MKEVVKNRKNREGSIYYSAMDRYLIKVSNIFFGLCVLVCLVVIFFNMYFSPANIIGTSMQPTYNNHWKVGVEESDIAYYSRFVSYNKGDVVIVDLSATNDTEYKKYGIKRLIATENDIVEFKNYQLYVNNIEIEESYLSNLAVNEITVKNIMNGFENTSSDWKNVSERENDVVGNYIKFKVPEGCVFYLGDNRTVSYDCSCYGPQPVEKLLAKVIFVVPYNQSLINFLWTSFLKLFY